MKPKPDVWLKPLKNRIISSMNKIISTKQKEIMMLCEEFHVQVLEVFGSATRDDFETTQSDIDFLVEFNQVGLDNYADNYFGLLSGLKDLFQQSVDLVVSSSINNPYFLESIKNDRAFLYAA